MDISIEEGDLLEAMEVAYADINPIKEPKSANSLHNDHQESKRRMRKTTGTSRIKTTAKDPRHPEGYMPMQKVKFKFRRTKLNLKRTRAAARRVFPKQMMTPQVPCTDVEQKMNPTHPLAELGISWEAWASQLEHGEFSTLEQLNLGFQDQSSRANCRDKPQLF